MVTIRRKPDFKKNFYEELAWTNNQFVCGIDEVGRGCLAGPVVTAAVILHTRKKSRLIKDSKQMSPIERLKAAKWVVKNAWYAIGIVNHRIIDRVNIYHATMAAMRRAASQLFASAPTQPSTILVDAMPLQLSTFAGDIIAFPFGERKSISIAAASIIAKITRDQIMQRMEHSFPGYHFDRHKGYCTVAHRTMLAELAQSPIHRISYIDHFETMHEAQLTLLENYDETVR